MNGATPTRAARVRVAPAADSGARCGAHGSPLSAWRLGGPDRPCRITASGAGAPAEAGGYPAPGRVAADGRAGCGTGGAVLNEGPRDPARSVREGGNIHRLRGVIPTGLSASYPPEVGVSCRSGARAPAEWSPYGPLRGMSRRIPAGGNPAGGCRARVPDDPSSGCRARDPGCRQITARSFTRLAVGAWRSAARRLLPITARSACVRGGEIR